MHLVYTQVLRFEVYYIVNYKNGAITLTLSVSFLSSQLQDTKSTDRRQTLLHFLVSIIEEKYPQLHTFHTELRFLDKAALGEGSHTHTDMDLQVGFTLLGRQTTRVLLQ